MTTTPDALSISDLAMSFGPREVLRSVSLSVPKGSIVSVLGPSGEGKTTLLRLIAGLERPTNGTISIEGHLVAGEGTWVAPEHRRVGLVPQEGALFPHLSVAGNVGFGVAKSDRAARVAEMLSLVGLQGSETRRPHELSGGQQHRVALARALAPRPALIVLDEPFSSLDAGLRAQVRGEVVDVMRAAGATALLVTHDQEEALSIADSVVVLLGGTVAQIGAPEAVYSRPTTAAVAEFVGDANLLPATLVTDTIASWNGQRIAVEVVDGVRANAGDQVRLLARPSDLTFDLAVSRDADADEEVDGGGRVQGVVRRVVYLGDAWKTMVELDGSDRAVTVHSAHRMATGVTGNLRVTAQRLVAYSST